MAFTQLDKIHMQKVVELAQKAYSEDQVPIGAILTLEGKEISSAHNSRELTQSPHHHAEFLAIERACSKLSSWRIPGATVYVNLEPCLMCTGLIYQSRITRVVFASKSFKGGGLCFIKEHEKELNLNHSIEISSGLMEEESSKLLKNFFKEKRDKF